MIIKNIRVKKNPKNPSKSVKQATRYLLDDKRDVEPEILMGDRDAFEAVASDVADGNYTSQVLRFTENDIPLEKLKEIATEFEEALMPGYQREQFSNLWVMHRDKGSIELHVLTADVDLQTGERIWPYVHKRDMRRLDHWKNAVNAENDFSDPNDPRRSRTIVPESKLPTDSKELKALVHNHIVDQIKNGIVVDRASIVAEMKAINLDVVRETKSSISIKTGGRNVRFKGNIYVESFRSDQQTKERIDSGAGRYSEERQDRAKKSRKSFEELYRKRSQTVRSEHQKSIEKANLRTDHFDNDGVFSGSRSRSRGGDFQPKYSNGSLPRYPEPYHPVQGYKPREKVLPVIKKTNNKEDNNNDEPSNKRNNIYYEEVFRGISERKSYLKGLYSRLNHIFRDIRKRSFEYAKKLRDDNKELSRDQQREHFSKSKVESLDKIIGKLKTKNISNSKTYEP